MIKRKVEASVVICTVSRLKKIILCLISLNKQSSNNFEVLIVDGGPDDKLEDVVKNFSRTLYIKRIKVNKHNLAFSRNQALKNISSPIVAFIDDDAQADGNWIENIIKVYKANPDVVGVGGQILSATNKYLPRFSELLFNYGSIKKELKTITGTNMSFNVQRLNKLKNYRRKRIFNEKYIFAGEETEACFYINNAGGRLIFDPSIVVHHFFSANLFSFIKKHFSYGHGDFLITNTPEYTKYNLIKGYILPTNLKLGIFFIPTIIPLIVIKKVSKFVSNVGYIWIPAIMIRELSYLFGLYSSYLKEKIVSNKIT